MFSWIMFAQWNDNNGKAKNRSKNSMSSESSLGWNVYLFIYLFAAPDEKSEDFPTNQVMKCDVAEDCPMAFVSRLAYLHEHPLKFSKILQRFQPIVQVSKYILSFCKKRADIFYVCGRLQCFTIANRIRSSLDERHRLDASKRNKIGL